MKVSVLPTAVKEKGDTITYDFSDELLVALIVNRLVDPHRRHLCQPLRDQGRVVRASDPLFLHDDEQRRG